jgi:hypothetical protein
MTLVSAARFGEVQFVGRCHGRFFPGLFPAPPPLPIVIPGAPPPCL